MEDLVRPTAEGLHCATGGFHVDPWKKVPLAVVTHAHSDHARPGCGAYLCSASGEGVLRQRMGQDARIETLAWGERKTVGGVTVSLHPAGHLLGSAQVRLERGGDIWVVSGDYKTAPDPSCEPFEAVPCRVFITESTFGLPVYRWPAPDEVFGEIRAWWEQNRANGLTSVLFAYALGKAQRILGGLAGAESEEAPVFVHGAVAPFLPLYAAEGRTLARAEKADAAAAKAARGKALVVAPGSAQNTPWLRKFGSASLAFASGWMRVRGARRRRALDRGFILSDHADWDGLVGAIRATGAERVGVTHGFTGPLVRWLQEQGLEAWELPTRYTGESVDAEESAPGGPSGNDAVEGGS